MNDELKQKLIDWGVDWGDVSERFLGNENLVITFMMKFLNDKSMDLLTENIAKEDIEESFKAVHTLKGVAGNLGMKAMLPDVSNLTELLCTGKFDGAKEMYDKIKVKYDSLVAILSEYKDKV